MTPFERTLKALQAAAEVVDQGEPAARREFEHLAEPPGIVEEWTEFGHHFQIERLAEPQRKGAGDRWYRLYDNGYPATGGQWHYTKENARSRADYLLHCSYADRISYLERRVAYLEGQIYKAGL